MENRSDISPKSADSGCGALFIDENRNIIAGEKALALLRDKSDTSFVDRGAGIMRVDKQRWEEAQRYELRTWLVDGLAQRDDRNIDHVRRFGGYAVLRGRCFEHCIELGCGPFTNVRHILDCCQAERIDLLDPLIDRYLLHPGCSYKKNRLAGLASSGARLRDLLDPVGAVRLLRSSFRVGGLFGRPVRTICSAIEDFIFNEKYDLVIMINVLEHCRDARMVFEKISRMLSPGGVLVFGDAVYHADEVTGLSNLQYDAGHPLRVDKRVVEEYLRTGFRQLMKAEYLSSSRVEGIPIEREEMCFVGEKNKEA